MGVPDKYDWKLLDYIGEGLKMIFQNFDKLCGADNNGRFAMRKLKARMNTAIEAVRKGIKQISDKAVSQDSI